MHSKIFQISKERVTDFITEYRYFNGFVGSIADYVGDMEKKYWKDNWDWLASYAKDSIEIKDGKLTIVSKKKYFESHYTAFMENIKKAANISLEQFMSDDYSVEMTGPDGNTYKSRASFLVSDINFAFSDKYGFYMDDNDEYYGMETFDDFMRHAKDGDVFYLGSVIDYHF